MEIDKIAFITLSVLVSQQNTHHIITTTIPLQVLAVSSRTATVEPVPIDYAAQMKLEAEKLRNDSAEGSFNIPEVEICKHSLYL